MKNKITQAEIREKAIDTINNALKTGKITRNSEAEYWTKDLFSFFSFDGIDDDYAGWEWSRLGRNKKEAIDNIINDFKYDIEQQEANNE